MKGFGRGGQAPSAPLGEYPAPMSLLRRGMDGSLMELVEEAGRNVQRSGLLMRELLADFPSTPRWRAI